MPVDQIEDLGYPDEDEFEGAVTDDSQPTDEPEDDEEILDEATAGFLDSIIKRIILFCEELCGFDLRPYQRTFAYRIIQSLILGDAEELTGLWSRQSGKTETLADVLAGCMVLFPKLAKSFEMFERFKRGLLVGIFAPVDDQSELLFSRIVSRLTSERATEFLLDPEIDEKAEGKSKVLKLKSGSYCRRQTANPRAKIEGATYHVIVIDESQDADEQVVRKSIHPMLAAFAGTMVKIGTPGYHKGDFYKAIQLNKRRGTRRGVRQNHFEYDWKTVAKYNPYYKRFVEKEKVRLGEDSDEFQMSYNLKWMLERGMLIVEDDLDYLSDPSMQLIKAWHRTPVVVGIDPARVRDSTVVTVMWVDWEYPDPAGYREHRILNWLEIKNTAWEEQYFEIVEFLDYYNIAYVGVDAQGMGSAVADRMQRLLGSRCEVIAYPSDAKNQAERWKHLIALLQRRLIIYPGHSKARRTRVWRRFRQQMSDAEKIMRGQYLLVQAPENEREAYDDYVDSAALACACTMNDTVPVVETFDSPFFRS
jgi:Terminase RNaseH-like domain